MDTTDPEALLKRWEQDGMDAPADGEDGEPVDRPEFDRRALAAMAEPLVTVIGGIACARARVTPLEPGEVQALADAVAGVAEQYDFDMSPKVAAWIGLGVTASAVIVRRERLDPPANDAEPVTDAKPAEKPVTEKKAKAKKAAAAKPKGKTAAAAGAFDNAPPAD
jgi:hypothetical protein